jgi:hypothetical protein
MSTRSVIAFANQFGAGHGSFDGRYCHWDGYPAGVGATLYARWRDYFHGDYTAMRQYLYVDHPAGWSNICNRDFAAPAGFSLAAEMAIYERVNRGEISYEEACRLSEERGPECYCHGERREEEQRITERDAALCGCEFAYVVTATGEMWVLASYTPEGNKMVGMFGAGHPLATWQVLATVDLNGSEPDWGRLGEATPATCLSVG